MLPSFCHETVTRIRPGTKTERGSEIPNWSYAPVTPEQGVTYATDRDIGGCSMQPAGTSLSEDGRVLGISSGFTLYAPPDADIMAGDRIRFRGNTYTINGDVRPWPSATGRLDHLLINLVRWQG